MIIHILVSTVDRGILKNKQLSELPLGQNLRMIVVNQKIGSQEDLVMERDYVQVINSETSGLSRSRNIALKAVSEGIGVIADDDVVFPEGFDEVIRESFRKHQGFDILSFKVRTPEGQDYKAYPTVMRKLNLLSILNVSSISIALRIESVSARNISFDENFGLGSGFVSGEENIFLADALKCGILAAFIPETIVIHPLESSGKTLTSRQLEAKGALFGRIYGVSGIIMLLLFCIKKRKELKKFDLNVIQAMSSGLRGYAKWKNAK